MTGLYPGGYPGDYPTTGHVFAHRSGLGQRLFAAGVDISGDIGALDHIAGSIDLLDVTLLRQSAYARTGGARDGSLAFTAFFNPGDN